MKYRSQPKKMKGFTIVEIAITLLIIAIVVAVGASILLRSRSNASQSKIIADFETFRSAMESYRVAQNPPVFPPTPLWGVLALTDEGYLDSTWDQSSATNFQRTGFDFELSSEAAKYTLTSDPTDTDLYGNTFYCMDATGVIRVDTEPVFTISNECDSSADVLGK